jgi:pre-mRNA-splicing factor 18
VCAGIQMEALRREIERKRKSSALIRPDTGGRKYFRRGDMEALRQRSYLEEHAREGAAPGTEPERESLVTQAGAGQGALSTKGVSGGVTDVILTSGGGAAVGRIEPAEVKRRLRAIGEVVTFFGESDHARESRLRAIQTQLGEEGTEGRLNVVGELLRKAAAAGGKVGEQFKQQETEEEKQKAREEAAKMPAPVLNR